MNKINIITAIILIVLSSGCASMEDAMEMKYCGGTCAESQSGYTGMKRLMEIKYCGGDCTDGSGPNVQETDSGWQQYVPNTDHRTMQMRNHGYGGCTPNFSTGGCL